MPPFALRSLRGKKRELERSLHCSQCESRQRPARQPVSLISRSPPLRFRSTYRRRSSWTLRVRVQKKVPNAERSTRCPGANLEANRSTWVQFKVSRRKQRRVGTLKQFGDGCDDVGFVCFLKIGETKINSGHSFISLSACCCCCAWFYFGCALALIP